MIVETAVLVGGLSWVFDKVLEHSVGAIGHDFCCEFARGAVRELTDPHKRPRNHDIARAVRGAQLDAMEDLLAGFAMANAPHWDLASDPATAHFLDQSSAYCRRERAQLANKETDPDFAPSATLTATIEGILTTQPDVTAADARAAALGEFAELAVLDELGAALKPTSVPKDFAIYLRAGAGKAHPRFLDLFGAGIAARLKDPENTHFRDILQAGWLADLKALGFETSEALARVENQYGGLRSEIDGIRRLLHEVVETLTGELRLSNGERTALAVDLASAKAELNGTNGLVAGFLETMLGRQVPPERFAITLMSMTADLRKADVQIDALRFSRNLTPQLAPIVARARAARDAGLLDEAAAALADITQTQQEARMKLVAHTREVAEELRLRCEGEAESAAAEGALARARLAYRDAAKHYRIAAEALSATDALASWGHLVNGALALFAQGEEFGDNAALEEAIQLYRDEALPRVPRRDHPLDWAGTQNNLASALATLGERESETIHLEEAVAAYRAAVEERTRDRVPLDWAQTQNDLGFALWRIGERESGLARLEEAVAAYQAALEERTRDRAPLDWAETQNNLGLALWRFGERESGTGRLEEAVAAYHAALMERTRDRVPLQWAETQNNLGIVLRVLGERENGTRRLEEAVAAYRAALLERTRDRVPLRWATTQNNFGTALRTLGEREGGTARLEEAVAAYRAALEERKRDRVPLDWAGTQNNLGNALRTLGEREGGTARLEEAIGAYSAALTERTCEKVPLLWAATQMNLGTALRIWGERESGTARILEAIATFNAALAIFVPAQADYFTNICRANRDEAFALLAQREGQVGGS